MSAYAPRKASEVEVGDHILYTGITFKVVGVTVMPAAGGGKLRNLDLKMVPRRTEAWSDCTLALYPDEVVTTEKEEVHG